MSTKRRLTCCVCGEAAGTWEQHWNRDTGYGVCVPCVECVQQQHHYSDEEVLSCYGVRGVNWGDAQDSNNV